MHIFELQKSYISQVLANIMTQSSHHFNILIVESPDVSDIDAVFRIMSSKCQ